MRVVITMRHSPHFVTRGAPEIDENEFYNYSYELCLRSRKTEGVFLVVSLQRELI